MKILITGSSGFLGRHFIKFLENKKIEIYISNTKIRNLNNFDNLLDLPELDYIFHFACYTKAGDWCLYNSGVQWEVNQTINTNILKYWRNYQPKAKMICIGTSCSYDPNLEMVEDNYMKGEPDDGLYTYAMTKRMLLQGLRSIKKQYGLNYCYFIPSTLYGKDYTSSDQHFIFDIFRKIKNGLNGDDVVLWGDGNQRRELIHVYDAVNLIYNLKDTTEEIINLSIGEDDSIKNFAKKICDLVGFEEFKIKYDKTKYVGVLKKKLNISKLKLLIPDYNFISFDKGIKDLL